MTIALPRETERLRFRVWQEDDLPLASELWGDPEVTRFISRTPLTSVEVHERLRRELDTLAAHAVFAGHHPDNAASRAMLLSLGFEHTHDELYAPTGKLHPSYLLTDRALAAVAR